MDADTIARELMSSEEHLHKAIIQILGKAAYNEQGLNTEYVGEQIFSAPKRKAELESLVHAAVWLKVEEQFAKAKPGAIIGLESAILYQTGYDALFDALVLVDASDEAAKANAIASGKFTSEAIDTRLKEQNYQDEWKEDADYVLSNDCPLDEFEVRCRRLGEIIGITQPAELPLYPMRMGSPKRGKISV